MTVPLAIPRVGRRSRWPGRGGAALLAVILALGGSLTGSALAAGQHSAQRPSLTQLYGEFMCVSCHESLAVARSPQSYSERQYIRDLIAQGKTAAQIKRSMVAQYGPGVLAVPPAHGFNLLVYVLPPVLVAIGLATLALTIPRWRRRAREAESPTPAGRLSPEDTRRLDDELGRYA